MVIWAQTLIKKKHFNHKKIIILKAIEREEQKTILMIKGAAKKNQMDVCKIAAKSLVQWVKIYLL